MENYQVNVLTMAILWNAPAPCVTSSLSLCDVAAATLINSLRQEHASMIKAHWRFREVRVLKLRQVNVRDTLFVFISCFDTSPGECQWPFFVFMRVVHLFESFCL
jgi:hypothetical protein